MAERDFKEPHDLLPEATKIREMLAQGIPRKPNLNVLLLGPPGAGKSSLINSLITAIDKNGYDEYAKRGAGGTDGRAAVTIGLQGLEVFSEDRKYMFKEGEHKFKCQVTFWDFPGLMDTDEERLLESLLKGWTPPRSSLKNIKSLSWRFWESWYSLAPNDKRMHLIIYCQPADYLPAEQLLQSITKIAFSHERVEYETTIMLAVTRVDKVIVNEATVEEAMKGLSCNDSTEMETKKKELMEEKKKERINLRAQSAAKHLKMEGVYERIIKVSSYASETAMDEDEEFHRNHVLDKQLCKLWKKILKPQYYSQFTTK